MVYFEAMRLLGAAQNGSKDGETLPQFTSKWCMTESVSKKTVDSVPESVHVHIDVYSMCQCMPAICLLNVVQLDIPIGWNLIQTELRHAKYWP